MMQNKAIRSLPVLALLLLVASPARAESDFELWTEAGITYKLSKRFRLGFDQHVRFDDNASRIERIMPDLHLRWRPKKWVYFQVGYRFLAQPQYTLGETYWDAWHRPYGDAGLKGKVGHLGVDYRLRYQEQFGWPYDEDGDIVHKHTIRNRLSVSWDFTPDLSLGTKNELFVRINDPDGALHKFRSLLELDWQLHHHEFTVFVGVDKPLDDDDEPTARILGLAYHHNL